MRRTWLSRRGVVMGAATIPIVFALRPSRILAASDDGVPFDAAFVRQLARDLAQKPYKAPENSLPDSLKNLSYDAYRTLRFLPDRALWRGETLSFEVQFFHRGLFFSNRIDIYQVLDGKAKLVRYSPSMFSFGQIPPPAPETDLGFGGFRLHAPINRSDYYDEVAVFLGASYFRAVAKGQTYGLSARGLAINTGDAKGEEFPSFKAFWIEKPQPRANSLVLHALLDSASATAAYRFTIRPGETTVFDVEMTLFPRQQIDLPGIAPLTSMFLFDANDRNAIDDYRPAVHDSDGLAVRNGRGEEIWRPLQNPTDLQVSSFADLNPRGFGLIQRQRNFGAYEDLESHFEKRPSLWIEPIGNWGEGVVSLIEIPTKEEIHDNVVAFWKPHDVLRAKGEYAYTYRLHWGAEKPDPPPLAKFTKTRIGAGPDNTRLFVLELIGEKLKGIDPAKVRGAVSADKGKIRNVVTQPNPESGGWRLSFQLAPEKAAAVELRSQLTLNDDPLSEVWIYRWTP